MGTALAQVGCLRQAGTLTHLVISKESEVDAGNDSDGYVQRGASEAVEL